MAIVLMGMADAVAGPEALFSLRAAGHEVRAFGTQGAQARLHGLPLARFDPIPDPSRDVAGAVAALTALIDAPDAPDAVLALDDISLWLAHRTPRVAARTAGAPTAAVEVALDKARQVAAARAAGLDVPPTATIATRDDLRAAAGTMDFPAILKPQLAARPEGAGLGRGGATYLADRAAALAFAQDTAPLAEPYLLQPLIAGVGEGVFGFATDTGVTGWSAHRRVRMMNPHGSGSSACRAVDPEPEIRAAAARMLAAIGWRGPFMVELLRAPDGTPWFMELNGRLWGSLALARRQGLEYPAMAVDALLGQVPGDVTARPWPHVQRHLGRDILHLMMVARGPKSDFHRPDWPRLGPALRAVLTPAPAAAFYNHDPAAPRFFLSDAARTVWRTLRRRG